MGLAKELRNRRKLEAREVLVNEWGDESGPFKLYCRSITCYDLDKLQKKLFKQYDYQRNGRPYLYEG